MATIATCRTNFEKKGKMVFMGNRYPDVIFNDFKVRLYKDKYFQRLQLAYKIAPYCVPVLR